MVSSFFALRTRTRFPFTVYLLQAALPDTQTERDALEIKTRYTSVSHKAMEEIPWRMKAAPAVRKQSRETKPDMVSSYFKSLSNHVVTEHLLSNPGTITSTYTVRFPKMNDINSLFHQLENRFKFNSLSSR